MTSKGKSFAKELADLFNPAPTKEHDPDGLDLGDGAQLASDDEFGEARLAPSKRAPEKSMLLRGDIVLDDAAYRGRKTSRAAVFGGAEDEDEDEGDDGEDVDLALEEVGAHEDDGEEQEKDGSSLRASTGREAGPSGRGRAAGARAGAGAGRGLKGAGKHRAAPLANGRSHGSSEDGEEEDTDDDDEGVAEEGEELSSGSISDVELEELGHEGTEDDEDSEGGAHDDDGDGAGPRANGHARGFIGDGEKGQGTRSDERERARRSGAADELETLEAEYEELQEEDERQLEVLRRKGERDREKGAAVRNQQVLYERALEIRILLQKCLQASNGLPRPDTYSVLAANQPDVREGYAQLASSARETLSELLDLQHALMARNAGISAPPDATADGEAAKREAAAAGSDRKRRRKDAKVDAGADTDADDAAGLDTLWRRVSRVHEALAPFRDVSLDSWHRRTVLSSGSGALRNSGLRALNQSISSQVQALMRDPAKFVKRTRLVVSACPHVLCEPVRADAAAAMNPMGSDGGLDVDRTGPSVSVAADVVDEERDPETYDDSEFYQQLLKEFLDKGLVGGAAAAPKNAKKRKLVDRRASKGRKLRYHVQEKLVAFMAPVDFTPPPFAANLFSNLFGHAGK